MSGFGAVVLVVSLYLLVRWVSSDNFRPIDPGPDPIPRLELWLLYGTQALGVGLLVWMVSRWLVKPWRRQGRITTDGLIILALPLMWMCDPWMNSLNNWFNYNAHLLNMGAWGNLFPGWLSPHQDRFGEPIVIAGAWVFWVFGMMALGCAVFRAVRARWPHWSLARFLVVGALYCIVADLAIEWLAVLLGWYAMPGGTWVMFPGRYQMPLLEPIVGGIQMFAWVCLRYFKDDKGMTLAERGVDRLRVRARQALVLRWLALTGALALTGLIYNLGIQYQALHSGAWPKGIPSYLTQNCPGYQTDPASCGGPGRAIPRND
jgi:hypothetical protein